MQVEVEERCRKEGETSEKAELLKIDEEQKREKVDIEQQVAVQEERGRERELQLARGEDDDEEGAAEEGQDEEDEVEEQGLTDDED